MRSDLLILALATALLFAVTIFLLIIATEPAKVLNRMRVKSKKKMSKLTDRMIRNESTGKILTYTQFLVDQSNVRLIIPYNIWIHFLLCIVSGTVSYISISRYISTFMSLAFALVAMMFPYIFLQLVSDIFARREKKNAVNFLIILKNFFKAGSNDIFQAFRNVTTYIDEPLKSYIDMMVYEYEHKINALVCLKNFRDKIRSCDLKLYIDNMAICYTQGGDIEGLTNTFIEDMSKADEEDMRQDTEDKILNYGLYVLLILNFIIIWWMINGSYRHEILGSIWGQAVFILDMLSSGYIMFMSLKKE